jgi:hypothetical protein
LIEHPPLHPGGRLAAPVGRWLARFAAKRVRRRLEREIRDYRQPPELRLGSRHGDAGAVTRQVFRSLIQVNFYPRSRQ